jgi:tetratricopeptide (TPR) repeat protein
MNLTIAEALQSGVAAHRDGKLEEADRFYTAILNVQPQHPDANHNLGVLAASLGRVEEALPFFETALESNNKLLQYWFSYLDALLSLGRIDDVNRLIKQGEINELSGVALERLKTKFPSAKWISSSQGQLYELVHLYQQAHYKKALELGQSLRKRFPKDLKVLNIIGAIFSDLGKFDQAIPAFRRVLVLSPFYARVYNNISIALNSWEKYSEALDTSKKAIYSDPSYADAFNNSGISSSRLGNYQHGLIGYNKAIQLKPDHPFVYTNRAEAFNALSEYKKAIHSLRKGLVLTPNHADAYNNLGVVLTEVGKHSEAIISYERAIQIKKNYPDPHYNLSNILAQINLADQKIDILKIKLTPFVEKKIGIKLICDSLIKSFLNNEISKSKQIQKRLETKLQTESFKILNIRDIRFFTSYNKMIKSLLVLQSHDKDNKKLSSVFHIGESHCLSFAHQHLRIRGESYRIEPRIIFGAKAWHFARPEDNKFKGILRHHMSCIPNRSLVFLSFGEIDCRQDEGILVAAIKSSETIEQLVYKTVCGYLNFISQQFLGNECGLFFFSVPAPVISSDGTKMLSSAILERIFLVKEFNKQLKRCAIKLGHGFIDTYSFTSNEHGASNNEFHLDGTHLSPLALKKIEGALSNI